MKTDGLTETQVEQYRKEGYLVLQSFFDRDVLAKTHAAIQRITDSALASENHSKILEIEPEPVDGKPIPRRIYNPFELDETFRELATMPALLDSIESLIGPNISLQHSKLNMKPSHVGSVVEWHQDLAYFPHTNDDLVTLLIYLDDATISNGCLRVLPRHHSHFFDHHTPDGVFAGMIMEDLENGQFGQPVSLPGPAGSLIFMHCILPHSSHPNRTPQPRRTLIFEYRATDSFPIERPGDKTSPHLVSRLLRGRKAGFARCAGPRPYIPWREGPSTSLYELQERTKVKIAAAVKAPSTS